MLNNVIRLAGIKSMKLQYKEYDSFQSVGCQLNLFFIS